MLVDYTKVLQAWMPDFLYTGNFLLYIDHYQKTAIFKQITSSNRADSKGASNY